MSDKKMQLLKFLTLAVWIVLTTSLNIASAEEPQLGVIHPLKSGAYGWKLDGGMESGLSIVQIPSEKEVAKYDLGLCFFCSGEEDNCEKDGVLEIEFASTASDPVIAAICHKGAHSQRLSIFNPIQDPENPIYSVTGDYWIDYEMGNSELKISYDRRNSDGGYDVIEKYWPE